MMIYFSSPIGLHIIVMFISQLTLSSILLLSKHAFMHLLERLTQHPLSSQYILVKSLPIWLIYRCHGKLRVLYPPQKVFLKCWKLSLERVPGEVMMSSRIEAWQRFGRGMGMLIRGDGGS